MMSVNFNMNQLNMVISHAMDYPTIFDAFYEYIKNHNDENADNVHINVDYKTKKLMVYGNAQKGMDAEGIKERMMTIAQSLKSSSNHGLGNMAFFRFAKRMRFISKREDKYYLLSFVGNENQIVSDTGEAHEMTTHEMVQYSADWHKIKRWPNGSIFTIEEVGECASSRFPFKFKIEDEFSEVKLKSYLKKKLGYHTKYRKYFVKFNDKKPVLLDAKLGTGKRTRFSIPSTEYPVDTDRLNNPRNIFELNDRRFFLRVDFDFWVSPSNNGEIRICERGQDALELAQAFSYTKKLSHKSIYLSSELNRYLSGYINFNIKPLDDKPGISVYSGARARLELNNTFGDALVNLLNQAEREALKPLILEHIHRSKSSLDETSSRELQKDMEEFFKQFPEVFDSMVQTANEGPVSSSHYTTCASCGRKAIPTRCSLEDVDKSRKERIYAPDDKEVYLCANCGKEWPRRPYTPPGTGTKKHRRPVYSDPPREERMPRRKRHGYGFRFEVAPFEKGDDRRFHKVKSVIRLNSRHEDYSCISNRAKKSGANKQILRPYERMLALLAIANEDCKDFLTYKKVVEDAIAGMSKWYWVLRKMKIDSQSDVVEKPVVQTTGEKSMKTTAEILKAAAKKKGWTVKTK